MGSNRYKDILLIKVKKSATQIRTTSKIYNSGLNRYYDSYSNSHNYNIESTQLIKSESLHNKLNSLLNSHTLL